MTDGTASRCRSLVIGGSSVGATPGARDFQFCWTTARATRQSRGSVPAGLGGLVLLVGGCAGAYNRVEGRYTCQAVKIAGWQ